MECHHPENAVTRGGGGGEGMKLIMQESDVCTDGTVAENLRDKLQTFADFVTPKLLLGRWLNPVSTHSQIPL